MSLVLSIPELGLTPVQVPGVNVPAKHDDAVHVNPAPVWVHDDPLASSLVQLPKLSAPSIRALASHGFAIYMLC